jgi:hypothetical protein
MLFCWGTTPLAIPLANIARGPYKQRKPRRSGVLVERMLELHKRLPSPLHPSPARARGEGTAENGVVKFAITPQEQERVKREIESTDRQIDKLVYELYGLTEEEIKIVEGVS